MAETCICLDVGTHGEELHICLFRQFSKVEQKCAAWTKLVSWLFRKKYVFYFFYPPNQKNNLIFKLATLD